MSSETMAMREQVYECHLKFTGITSYGVELEDVLSGKVAPPPEGARFDVAFEGDSRGRLAGRVKGVDYVTLRADGRMELDVRAEVTTADGSRIALAANGVGMPQPGSPIAQIRENVKLTTSHPDFAWVNRIQIWAPGTVNLAEGTLDLTAFEA